ncbi:MAG: hypothetical protein HY655_05040 [Acidobacteria bacterium]|nr:hypothetical protein [Acidobacteriota bacterium]
MAHFVAEAPAPCGPCPELTILTWTNRPEQTLVERCLDHWGVPYRTLGRRLPEWRNDMKLFLNVEALGGIESEYVMALDADDILVVSRPHDIVEAYRSFSCDMVFSAEKNNWPPVSFLAEFEESIAESAYRYLNSGAWIGRTDACQRFFRDCLQEDNGDIVAAHTTQAVFRDDQGVIRKTFRRHYPAARLDYHCRIFQSLNQVSTSGELAIEIQTGLEAGHLPHPALFTL